MRADIHAKVIQRLRAPTRLHLGKAGQGRGLQAAAGIAASSGNTRQVRCDGELHFQLQGRVICILGVPAAAKACCLKQDLGLATCFCRQQRLEGQQSSSRGASCCLVCTGSTSSTCAQFASICCCFKAAVTHMHAQWSSLLLLCCSCNRCLLLHFACRILYLVATAATCGMALSQTLLGLLHLMNQSLQTLQATASCRHPQTTKQQQTVPCRQVQQQQTPAAVQAVVLPTAAILRLR